MKLGLIETRLSTPGLSKKLNATINGIMENTVAGQC